VELFDGSVAENIARFEREPDAKAIIAAAKAAGVHDLIVKLPEGYETNIGESGANLSADDGRPQPYPGVFVVFAGFLARARLHRARGTCNGPCGGRDCGMFAHGHLRQVEVLTLSWGELQSEHRKRALATASPAARIPLLAKGKDLLMGEIADFLNFRLQLCFRRRSNQQCNLGLPAQKRRAELFTHFPR
jgi:hypothetical protein